MADLTYIERANIEKFLGMRGGYVMDFSDRTFQEFVGEAVGLDIDNEKYHYSSNSKANRLRQFIKFESNYTFGKLLSAFCDYWLSKFQTGDKDPRDDKYLYKECIQIAERLKQEIIAGNDDDLHHNNSTYGNISTIRNSAVNIIFSG
jgi:hypothetical protein